jgi:hypothetical protein
MHIADPLVSGTRPSEVDIAIEKLNHQALLKFWQKG